MTPLNKDFLKLIVSAIDGIKVQLDTDDFDALYSEALRHDIVNIIYYGINNSEIKLSDETENDFSDYTFKNFTVDTQQKYELSNIENAFEKNGIDYMPVKGAILKNQFPSTDMRSMGDVDILVKKEQYGITAKVMQELGFESEYESDHELVWDKPLLHVELHKRLIPTYNESYYEYFGDGWKRAKLCEGHKHRYELSTEDHYIYIFTHLAKHYRDGGAGVRHMTDLYVIGKQIDDFEYIKGEIEKLGLLTFWENICKTLDVWFRDGKEDSVTSAITDYIFESGTFGSYDANLISRAVRESQGEGDSAGLVSFKRTLSVLFPPYRSMCEMYPFTEKVPFLLPAMWVYRWFRKLFFERDRLVSQKEQIKAVSAKNIKDFEKSLDFVGLNFDFKE